MRSVCQRVLLSFFPSSQFGKADYQGCGHFNPQLVFSKKEADDFARAGDKSQRDERAQ